ncbi:MAG: RNA polymerase sigma factor [bacterium]
MRKHKFIKAYRQFNEPIYRFIYFKVSQREIAEDLASEVFLKSWQFCQNNKITNIRALLYKIARDLVIDYYRKQKPVALENQEILIEDKNHIDLQKALSQLTEDERDAILLYYFEGFSHQEIAQIMNKTNGAIRALTTRARKKIKQKL